MDEANQAKYEEIRKDYAKKGIKGKGRATVSTLILPSVGPVPLSAKEILITLNIRARSAARVLRDMSVAAIKINAMLRGTLPPPVRARGPGVTPSYILIVVIHTSSSFSVCVTS